MSYSNYHTHCNFCDGKGTVAEFVTEAVRIGMPAIGFSSHAPLPFETSWNMKRERLVEYVREVGELTSSQVGKLEVYCGLEIDYIPGVIGPWHESFINIGLDYRIGSVHFLGQLEDGTGWTVDDSREIFEQGFKQTFNNNPRALVGEFYSRVRRMAGEQCPDIIAHFDLVKLHNRGDKYWREEESWYRREVCDTLEAIRGSNAIVEINTGAMSRGRLDVPYPSQWAWPMMRELGIRVMLGADAHVPKHLNFGFEEVVEGLIKAGYRDRWEFRRGVGGLASWRVSELNNRLNRL